MKIVRSFLVIGIAVLATSACATAGSGGSNGDRVSVTVENTATPPSTLTVWMEKDNGMRQRLGTVTPNDRGNFSYNVPGVGQYRFVATTRTGGDMGSQYFTISEGSSSVSWDIGANSVVVR